MTGANFNHRQDQLQKKLRDAFMEKGDILADLVHQAKAYDPLDRALNKIIKYKLLET